MVRYNRLSGVGKIAFWVTNGVVASATAGVAIYGGESLNEFLGTSDMNLVKYSIDGAFGAAGGVGGLIASVTAWENSETLGKVMGYVPRMVWSGVASIGRGMGGIASKVAALPRYRGYHQLLSEKESLEGRLKKSERDTAELRREINLQEERVDRYTEDVEAQGREMLKGAPKDFSKKSVYELAELYGELSSISSSFEDASKIDPMFMVVDAGLPRRINTLKDGVYRELESRREKEEKKAKKKTTKRKHKGTTRKKK